MGFAVVVFVSFWVIFLHSLCSACGGNVSSWMHARPFNKPNVQIVRQQVTELFRAHEIRRKEKKKKNTSIHPTKGIHLVVCVSIISWVIRVRVCAAVNLLLCVWVKPSQRSTYCHRLDALLTDSQTLFEPIKLCARNRWGILSKRNTRCFSAASRSQWCCNVWIYIINYHIQRHQARAQRAHAESFLNCKFNQNDK